MSDHDLTFLTLSLVQQAAALRHDPDGADVVPPTPARTEELITFIIQIARLSAYVMGRTLQVPELTGLPDGSVDVHWGYGHDRELLLNIPNVPGQLATYYGDDRDGTTIKGQLNVMGDHLWIAAWLTQPIE